MRWPGNWVVVSESGGYVMGGNNTYSDMLDLGGMD